MKPAHFTLAESGEFEPNPFAGGDDHLNGPAVVGLAAQAGNGLMCKPIRIGRQTDWRSGPLKIP